MVRSRFHPWQVVREMGVRVLLSLGMPWESRGRSDPATMTIYLNRRRLTTQTERRCTLTHELVHLDRRDQGPQSDLVERKVRAEAAKLLIREPDLEDALRWSTDLYELSDHLWVTEDVMRDRIAVMKYGYIPASDLGPW